MAENPLPEIQPDAAYRFNSQKAYTRGKRLMPPSIRQVGLERAPTERQITTFYFARILASQDKRTVAFEIKANSCLKEFQKLESYQEDDSK